MTIEEQLTELIKSKYKSVLSFSKIIGIKYTTLTGILGERSVLGASVQTVIKICDELEIEVEPLIEGQIVTKSYDVKLTSSEKEHIQKYRALNEHGKKMVDFVLAEEYESSIEEAEQEHFYMFPRFSGNRASAGYGYDLSNPDEWREICVVDTPEAHRADFAVQIEGDSMMPDYHDGDIVYIKMASEIPVGQVGLFMQNGMGYIKEAGKNRPISRNPEYPNVNPEEGDIKCVGRVIGIAQLVDVNE